MGKKVQVLMSTYNGEKYLREQLDSILKQDFPDLSLLVRDDGSVDGTVGILEEYAGRYKHVEYYEGENIGVVNSFFDLMKRVDLSASYYAFSDQDDVWMEGKISRAVKILNKMDSKKAALYCGRELLVDERLNEMPMKIRKTRIRPNFGNALVENVATGATCVCNLSLIRMLREHIPDYTVMHDWWMYLTSSCFGKVYFDEKPYLKYRQHAHNVLGSRNNYWEEIKVRLRRFRKDDKKFSRQAGAFLKSYQGEIPSEKLELLLILINYKKSMKVRMRALFTRRIFRQRRGDHLALKLFYLINHI